MGLFDGGAHTALETQAHPALGAQPGPGFGGRGHACGADRPQPLTDRPHELGGLTCGSAGGRCHQVVGFVGRRRGRWEGRQGRPPAGEAALGLGHGQSRGSGGEGDPKGSSPAPEPRWPGCGWQDMQCRRTITRGIPNPMLAWLLSPRGNPTSLEGSLTQVLRGHHAPPIRPPRPDRPRG